MVVSGKPLAFNADFARQVLFLSQQLDCSEVYIAGLLHSIMAENPNIGAVSCVEATIVEFHQRRRYLVDCLRFLLAEASQPDSPNSARIHGRITEFVERELVPGYAIPGGRVSLAQEILDQIEALGTTISKVHNDKKNAGTNTTATTLSQGEFWTSALEIT